MDIKLFLTQLEQALQAAPGSFKETDRLEDLEGWDSIGALAVIAMVDEKYGVTLDANALQKCKNINDLANLVETGE
jgi:acyl carrier protein